MSVTVSHGFALSRILCLSNVDQRGACKVTDAHVPVLTSQSLYSL